MKEFDKLVETIKNNFDHYDHITFYIYEWISLGILTNQNFLYIIDEDDQTLRIIDLEVEEESASYNGEFWKVINESIKKGKQIKF